LKDDKKPVTLPVKELVVYICNSELVLYIFDLNTFRRHLIKEGSSIKDAMVRLNILARDAIVFIVNEQNQLIGSLTDGDVRRGLIKGSSIDSTVEEIMQKNPRYLIKEQYDLEKVIELREGNFRIIPILDQSRHVLNVINFNEIKSYLPVDAVIMAGGRGKRLNPLTESIPKPLLKLDNKPIIEYNIDRLRLFGIDDFWISLKYLGEQIKEAIGSGKEKNITIKYIWEQKPMGTIGSVSKINDFLHDYVLIINSDILTNINYEEYFLDFLNQDADFSVLTIPYAIDIPYAILETENRHILNLREKPTYTYYSNGGIYLLKRELLDYIPEDEYFNATDLIDILIKDRKKVISFPHLGYWLDIGRHEDYLKAQRDIKTINLKS